MDWILGFFLAPPSGSLSSFLARFVPAIRTPTLLALLFVGIADGTAGMRYELKARLSYRRGAGRWLIVAALVPLLAMRGKSAFARPSLAYSDQSRQAGAGKAVDALSGVTS